MDGEQISQLEYVPEPPAEKAAEVPTETSNETDKWKDIPDEVILNHPRFKGLQKEISKKDVELSKERQKWGSLHDEISDLKEIVLPLAKAQADTLTNEDTANALRERANKVETNISQRQTKSRQEAASTEASETILEMIEESGLKRDDPAFKEAVRLWGECEKTGNFVPAIKEVHRAINDRVKSEKEKAVKDAQQKTAEESKTRKLASVDTASPSAPSVGGKKYTLKDINNMDWKEYDKLPAEVKQAARDGKIQ